MDRTGLDILQFLEQRSSHASYCRQCAFASSLLTVLCIAKLQVLLGTAPALMGQT